MATILSFSLLFCLVSYTKACCTPDQWEGYQPSYGGYARHHRMGVHKEFSSVSYDAVNKRRAVFMTYIEGDKENRYQVITHCGDRDYQHQSSGCRVYVVDLQKDKCWMKISPEDFRKSCIPKDAKDNGHGTIGLGDNSMKIISYVMERKSVTAYVSVGMISDGVCVPVSETLTGIMHKVGFMQYVGFIDFSAGIKNETVFQIPEQCQNNLDTSLEAVFSREHFILAV